MKFNWIKRVFCLLLCALTLFGYLPAPAQAATDYSDYTFQLWSASDGGASGPMYVNCYYMNYQWWTPLEYYPGSMGVNDRFETRVHFEKDASTGKYRLFYYGVQAYQSTFTVSKYYLTGATVPTDSRKESYGFYYGDLYGYEYITLTGSSSSALLWEVTSAGYLKTTYKNKTHYLWTTTTPYGSYDGAKYLFRLRTTTAAKGSHGMPVCPSYGWFDLSDKHAHTPGEKVVTGVEPATCTRGEATSYAIYCSDESCGAKLKTHTYTVYSNKNPDNHPELAERKANETAANCQSPYTYDIETYCTGCKKVMALQGPFQEGELGDHVPGKPVKEKETIGNCITKSSYENVIYCSLCPTEISRETVYTEFGSHAEESIPPEPATCTVPGKTEGTFCTICSTVLVEQTEITPKGHSEIKDPAVAPNCTETGLTEGKHCASCGEVLVEQTVVDALGHTVVTDKALAPDCTNTGLTEGQHCSVCHAVLVEQIVLDALGHTLVTDKKVDATCTEPGLTEGKHCSVCSEILTAQEVIPATGHNMENGICSICGEPEILYSGVCGAKANWKLDSQGKLTISGTGATYSYGSSNPAPWNQYSEQIFQVVVEDGITSLGDYSFHKTPNLSKVSLPNTLQSIRYRAFYHCPALCDIVLPEGLKTIEMSAFSQCTALTQINIPTSVTSVEYDAFSDCNGLTAVHITDLTAWCNIVFGGYYANPLKLAHNLYLNGELITDLVIPANLMKIGVYTFQGGSCFQSITIPYGVTSIDLGAFYGCSNVKELKLPDSVTFISDFAFANWDGLTEVVLPNRLVTLGEQAFAGCDNLRYAYIPNSVTTIKNCNGNLEGADGYTGFSAIFAKCPEDMVIYCGAEAKPSGWVHKWNYRNLKTELTTYWGVKKIPEVMPAGITIQNLPTKTWYAVGETVDLTGIQVLVENPDGSTYLADASTVRVQSGNTSITGVQTVTVTYFGQTAQFDIIVHTVTGGEVLQPSTGYPESLHNYSNHTNQTWEYRCEGADSLKLTFSGNTKLEMNYDYIYIYDGSGNRIGTYTGQALANKTVTVPGDTVKIKLTSDSSNTYYGFSLSSIYASYPTAPIHEPTDDGVYTKPGCYTDGYTTHTCFCGEIFTVTDAGTAGHTVVDIPGTEPTCTESGLTPGKKCNACGEITMEQTIIPANGHTEEVIPGKTPTCTESGLTEGKKCTVCGETTVSQTVIPANGHTEQTLPGKEPTCTESGLTEGKKCTVCGETTVSQTVIPATGHTEETLPEQAPTCTESGLTEGKKCTVCGISLVAQTVIPANGHTHNIPAPTETQDQICITCGTVLAPATGHQCINHLSYYAHKDATCTEAGHIQHYGCTCGKKYEDAAATKLLSNVVIPAKGHSASELAGYAPTCTTQGLTEGSYCVRCGEILTQQNAIPALGHVSVTNAAVEPTCTTTGKTEGSHCARCGEVLTAQEAIPSLGHSEEIIPAIAPDCTSTGLTEGSKCSVCGEVLVKQEIVPALGHTEVIDEAVAPTCTTTGLTEGKHCSVCGETIVAQTAVNKLPHVEEPIPGAEPTCTATGLTEGKKCSVCGTTLLIQNIIPALGHTEVIEAAVAPTCTTQGLTEGKHCDICGTTLVSQTVIPALGHSEETIPAVAPTCTAAGLTEGKVCTVCGVTTVKQETVPATGHSWTDGVCEDCGSVCEHIFDENGNCPNCGDGCDHIYEESVTAPTCTVGGYTTYTCTVCGHSYNGAYQDALGHSWKAATCVDAKICTVCGTTEGEPNGHNYDTVVTAPTCTAGGYTTHTCTVCGHSFQDAYVNATGHSAGIPVEENRVEPTCTEEGSYETVTRCAVCGEELSRIPGTIPAKGHSYELLTTPPTCTQQGYTTYTCGICHHVYTADYTPAKGHSYGDWIVLEEVTCLEDGLQRRDCASCEVFEQKTVPAPGHNWLDPDAVIRECGVCGVREGGYRIELSLEEAAGADTFWIDGKAYPVNTQGDRVFVDVESPDATNLAIYTVSDPYAADPHTQYPTGMRVWMLKFEDGAYTATHIPEFDNLLQYSGSSIRIVGVKGIRMITSIDKDTREALIKNGLAGYKLMEYGTALAWASDLDENNPLVLGREYTKSNFAYKRGEADPIFNRTGNLIQYTNVLVGFTDDQCIPDIVMRSYIILEDADGNQVTLYGGEVVRSIGYIAWQNRNVFNPGNAAYDYVWNIIHHVYGDRYDEDYKG